jgi:hypothetical protein
MHQLWDLVCERAAPFTGIRVPPGLAPPEAPHAHLQSILTLLRHIAESR